MDHPYNVVRECQLGRVSRGRARYLGDAMAFVKAVVAHEVNSCTWRVINDETGLTCFAATYFDGKVTVE